MLDCVVGPVVDDREPAALAQRRHGAIVVAIHRLDIARANLRRGVGFERGVNLLTRPQRIAELALDRPFLGETVDQSQAEEAQQHGGDAPEKGGGNLDGDGNPQTAAVLGKDPRGRRVGAGPRRHDAAEHEDDRVAGRDHRVVALRRNDAWTTVPVALCCSGSSASALIAQGMGAAFTMLKRIGCSSSRASRPAEGPRREARPSVKRSGPAS